MLINIMQRKFFVILFSFGFFYINTVKSVKINQSTVTSGEITKINEKESVPKIEVHTNNINSTGPILYPESKSNNNAQKENLTTKLFMMSSKLKEKINLKNLEESFKLTNKTEYYSDENNDDISKDGNKSVHAFHKSFVRQTNSKIHMDTVHETKGDFLATKPYSEKDFIPSPELKTENLNSGEQKNFDTFQPINLGYNFKEIEPKQELYHHYHHFFENPYNKLEQNLKKYSETNYKFPITTNIMHRQQIPNYSIPWAEYQLTSPEKNYFDQHNLKDIKHITDELEDKYKNSEIGIVNSKRHHDIQQYEDQYTSTSEIPPAPVTEDVKDIKSDHPYTFEIVAENEIKFNNDLQKEYGAKYSHDETSSYTTILPTSNKNQHFTEIWDYKRIPDRIHSHGNTLLRQEPWKDILQVLTAIVPIGLLLTAFTPNVVVVNPNATVPVSRPPFGNVNLYTKQRTSAKTKEIFDKKLNEVSNLLHNNLKSTLSNSKCVERAFCELSRKADNSNIEELKELLQLIVKRNQGLQQIDDSMFELFETAKSNNCSNYKCNDEIK